MGLAGLSLTSGCGDDDSGDGNGGSGGSGGSAGSGNMAGSGGSSGNAGSAGNGNMAGSGGGGMGTGPTGTIEVLSSDAAVLLAPTTAAIRGTNVFVAIGQLGELPVFGGDDTPALPFSAISMPVAGGALGPSVELPGDDFYPEGIAAAADGTLYVGSINTGEIVRVPANSTTAEDFVADGAVAERGAVGMTVDDERGLLWFCDTSPNAAGGALVGVDLEDGTESVRHDLPNPVSAGDADAGTDAGDAGDAGAAPAIASFCNDVRLNAADDLLVTDSFGGRIFRIPAANAMTANSAEVWLQAPETAPPMPGGFGVNGLAFVGNRLIIANGGLFAINPAAPATNIQPITLTLDGDPATLCGPDGIVAVPDTDDQLIVVENGFCGTAPARVIKVTLDL
jgi:sugar lactone lactonase YvrE